MGMDKQLIGEFLIAESSQIKVKIMMELMTK